MGHPPASWDDLGLVVSWRPFMRDPQSPKAGPNTGVLPLQFRFGLRGGELVTLTMAGRVAVGNGRIEVRDPAPLADPALNHGCGTHSHHGGGSASADCSPSHHH